MLTTKTKTEKPGVLDQMAAMDHEELAFFQHGPSRLRAIVAIDNTTAGPAVGGVRMYPYPDEAEAVKDVLRLARAMTYKAAVAGLSFGGGKAVIIGDPKKDKSTELFRAFGRFENTLGGRYIASTDVGVCVEDLLIIRQETPHVIGLPVEEGGGGDTSLATATGVWKGMKVFAREAFGTDSLKGLRVLVQGVGKVGHNLLRFLAEEGAKVIISDADMDKATSVGKEFEVPVLAPEAVYGADCDIFSPCAMGSVLNDETIPQLRCRVVAGSANNQLAEPRHGYTLQERGIWYAPDFVINAGGLVNVCDELRGYCQPRAWRQLEKIAETLGEIIAISKMEGIPTSVAADRLAVKRLDSVRELQRIWVPPTHP